MSELEREKDEEEEFEYYYLTNSVTRLLDYLFNIGQLQAWNTA